MTETVDVPIDDVRQLWSTRTQLLLEIEERKEAIEQLDALIKERLPDEDHITARIDGRPAFTYAYESRWTEAKFREDYPQLHKQYSVPTLKDVMDWAKFVDEHPALARQYQVRALKPWRPRRGRS